MKTINYGEKNDCTVYGIITSKGIVKLDEISLKFEAPDVKINYDSGIYPGITDVGQYICDQVYINKMHLLKSWTVKAEIGTDFSIVGTTLIEAIEKNFKNICDQARLGNAAGYKIHDVTVRYNSSILGGKGGAELIIVHSGLPLANGKTDDTERIKIVWIYAAPGDLPDDKLPIQL